MVKPGRTRAIALAVTLAVAGWQAQHVTIDAQPAFFTIQPAQQSGVSATTLTRNTVNLPPGTVGLDILINVTAGGTATGTLQIYLEDSIDGGTTWDDVVSSLTFALGAAPVTQRFFITGMLIPSTVTTATSTNTTQGSAAAAETLAAGSARQGPFGTLWRVREKLSAPSGSPVGATYTITAVFMRAS
jgi:hypothetical protein